MLYFVLMALAIGLMVGGLWFMKRPGDESTRSMADFKRGLKALDEQSRTYPESRPRAGRFR